MSNPSPIPKAVWDELAQIPLVRDGYGLDCRPGADPGAELASMAYGAAFDAACGPLYVVQDDALGGLPLAFVRVNGELSPLTAD